MQVTVMFLGPLSHFVGQEAVCFELPQGATYGDLLDDIGRRFGDKLHHRYWDPEANCFKEQILVVGTSIDYCERNTPLSENENIKVIPFLFGG
jgi:molybdopterin converting factor small subunit